MIERRHVVYVVVDVRGFTKWYNHGGDAEEAVVHVLPELWRSLRESFHDSIVKPTGDGGFVTLSVDPRSFDDDPTTLIKDIWTTTDFFRRACAEMSAEVGEKIDLSLGWGLARGNGWYFRQENDYVSRHANKAFRLCDLARPRGIVIDAVDFDGSALQQTGFKEVLADVSGFGHCRIWVSPEVRASQ